MGCSDESTLNGVNGGLSGDGLRSIMVKDMDMIQERRGENSQREK